MGFTRFVGRYDLDLAPMPEADLRYAQRHIEKQAGLRLDRRQVESLWRKDGRRAILAEVGVVRTDVCVGLVDFLCNELLGIDWPLNGYQGEDGTFFHRFTTAAIEAGYVVASRNEAA